MEYLYAPWRERYIRDRPDGCFICRAVEGPDEENYVLYRGQHVIVLLNIYPYSYGHILIAPVRHVSSPEDLTEDEVKEMFTVLKHYLRRAREAFHPEGFNIGINVGEVAGAGLPGHLHVHVVPRWKRDSGFMEVIAGAKVVSFDVERAYRELRELFRDLGYPNR